LTWKPKLIIVSKTDRFAHSLSGLLKTLEFLEQNSIGFVSVNDSGIDTTTPNGRLLLQILGALAEFERNMINYRTKAGREQAIKRGIRFGSHPLKRRKALF
jgi:DNA invertase Pin-like site-specific DNA recombinase